MAISVSFPPVPSVASFGVGGGIFLAVIYWRGGGEKGLFGPQEEREKAFFVPTGVLEASFVYIFL